MKKKTSESNTAPRSSKEVKDDLEELTKEFQAALKIETDEKIKALKEEDERYRALLKRMIGRRVLITVKGPYKNKEGFITRHAGKTKQPSYWYVRLDDGTETRKHRYSFDFLDSSSHNFSPFKSK